MKITNRVLLFLHLFVGTGAIAGGLAAITDPYSPLGVPVELLQYSPFSNFFIPGILLFGVIGLGNLAAAAAFRFKTKGQGYMSGVFGGGLMVWIVVQCIMLRAVASLHVIFFIIGVVQTGLSASLLFTERLFPFNALPFK